MFLYSSHLAARPLYYPTKAADEVSRMPRAAVRISSALLTKHTPAVSHGGSRFARQAAKLPTFLTLYMPTGFNDFRVLICP
jgi:hypothetical protein